MTIDPERVKALFLTAIERADPAGRRAFLDAEAGDDAELRRRLDALLAAYDQPPGDLDRPLAADPGAADGLDATRSTSSPPRGGTPGNGATVRRTGDDGPDLIDTIIAERYKIRQEIGEGGMGTVFLAEQLRPIRRQVALKLIKRGMDSKNVLARFESERQALALMDHPHIARVLDAGTTIDGRPFFVMDLVKGIPITEYCDAHRLDLNARLALFRQVCQAVQHAHQKGIIHRDLKPSNILVEAHDGKPVPKVIDFGLAKATSGLRLTEQSLFTAFGSVAGTPLYMAPEQASFNALDVDTRADIYALGVVLYELLTGSTPIARESMRQAALDEMLRVVREVEPPTPSSRISTSEALPSLAAMRQVEPARLSRLVRGELDWIVMKALAKERERRYASAVGLADDLERHLNREPVSAGPTTAVYRLSKFVRRNGIQVAAAGLVLLALVVGVIGTTLGLLEAQRQAEIAFEQELRAVEEGQRVRRETFRVWRMNDILVKIFEAVDPSQIWWEHRPLTAVLADQLDQATAEIEAATADNQLSVASVQMTLGRAQLGLGYPDRAIALFSKARATFAATLSPDDPRTLTSMDNLARGYHAAGQHERALKLFEETLALRRSKLEPDQFDVLSNMGNLAVAYTSVGQNERAMRLNEEVLAIKTSKVGLNHIDTQITMGNLAFNYRNAGQTDRAIKLYEEALAIERSELKPNHPSTLTTMGNLANAYADAGQYERAIKLHEEALAIRRSTFEPNHPDTLISMGNLASNYCDAGQTDRAIKLYEEALALGRAKLGPDHPTMLNILEGQARCLADSGQLGRAGVIFDEVIALRRKSEGEGHRHTFRSRMNRAELDLARGRLDEAEAADRAILGDCRARLGPDDRATIVAGLDLARVLEARGARDAAAPLLRDALAWARKNPTVRRTLAAALTESGRSRLGAGDWTAAERLLREALAIREAEMPQHWLTAEVRSLLGGALLGQEKATEAAPRLRAGYKGMAKHAAAIPLVDRPRLAEALDRLIAAGEAAGTKDEVARWKAERVKLGAGGSKR